jgi:hypothetical protein
MPTPYFFVLWGKPEEVVLGFVGIILAITAAHLPLYLFCITVNRTMLLIAPENRKMRPEGGFLLLIPVFNVAWQFVFFGHLADSVAAEYRSRSLELKEDRPLYFTGLMAGIVAFAVLIPAISKLAAAVSLVLYIIYWIKLAEIKKALTRPEISDEGKDADAASTTPEMPVEIK